MKIKLRKNLLLVVVLFVAVLTVKTICFVRGYPEYYNDTAETILSCVYYMLMLGLCFFAGREKWGYSILLCVLLGKLLVIAVAALTQWGPLVMVFRFLGASHYLVTEAVSGLERVGEILPDVVYWGAHLLVYLCFAVTARFGRKTKRGKYNESSGTETSEAV